MACTAFPRSSMLRVLCGLWPVVDPDNSAVIRPAIVGTGGLMFLPQTPFLVLGSLREQIIYPGTEKVRGMPCAAGADCVKPLWVAMVGSASSSDSTLCRFLSEVIALPSSRVYAITPPTLKPPLPFLALISHPPPEFVRGRLASPPAQNTHITNRELIDVLRLVRLEHLLERVYDTANVEGNSAHQQQWEDVLSGGEKQRLQMARLFFARPRFAILDEATSNVDLSMEEVFYRSVFSPILPVAAPLFCGVV